MNFFRPTIKRNKNWLAATNRDFDNLFEGIVDPGPSTAQLSQPLTCQNNYVSATDSVKTMEVDDSYIPTPASIQSVPYQMTRDSPPENNQILQVPTDSETFEIELSLVNRIPLCKYIFSM